MKTSILSRVFVFNGLRLPDPGAEMSPAAVKDYYAGMYPELTTAEVLSPKEVGDSIEHHFRKTTGTKGRSDAEVDQRPFVERLQAAVQQKGATVGAQAENLSTSLYRALNVPGTPLATPSEAIALML